MSWRDILTIQTEADPFVLMRVSAIIAVDNTIPARLNASVSSTEEMELVVELRNLADAHVCYLASKIEYSIPSVLRVSRIHEAGS